MHTFLFDTYIQLILRPIRIEKKTGLANNKITYNYNNTRASFEAFKSCCSSSQSFSMLPRIFKICESDNFIYPKR